MASIELRQVSKIYPGSAAGVKDIDLSVADGEFVIFLGPSGCGKSTLLRSIAGLESITAGDILINGEIVNHVAPRDRDVAHRRCHRQQYGAIHHVAERRDRGGTRRRFSGGEHHCRVRTPDMVAALRLIAQDDHRALRRRLEIFQAQRRDVGHHLVHERADLITRDACHAARG